MPRCTLCHQDLPESDFYPSALKKSQYQCRKCIYEHYQKKSNKKYNESLKQLDEKDFDRYYGGIKINITNYPQEFEISQTSGEYFRTKNKEEFIEHLLKIIKSQS